MQEITERLKKIKYQLLKEEPDDWTIPEKIKMVQSIYDAAINDDSPDMSGEEFPTEALGMTLTWSNDNRTLEIDGGSFELVDDLTDDIVPTMDDQLLPGAFQTNGEFFYVNNSIFELRTA